MKKKKLLFLGYRVPEYNVSTGDRYQTQMLEELSRDFEVHLAVMTCSDPSFRDYHLSRYAAEIYVDYLHFTIDSLKKKKIDFDVVMFGKSDVAYIYPLLKTAFPGALTVVNTVDIQFRRELMLVETAKKYGAEISETPFYPPEPGATKKEELAFYRRVDYVVTVSDEERKVLAAEGIPEQRIFVCHIAQAPADAYYNPDGTYLTFVGYVEHLPNYVSMKAFVERVLPRMDDYFRNHGYQIAIIGRDYDNLYGGLAKKDLVIAPGYVDDAELRSRYYANTCLSLVPLVAGSGVKGKILEAFAHGLPVVTTDVGLQGLEQFRDCVVHIDMDKPVEAAEKIIHFLDNREERNALSERATRKLAEYNAGDDNYRALRLRLDTIMRFREPEDRLLGALLSLRDLKWRYLDRHMQTDQGARRVSRA